MSFTGRMPFLSLNKQCQWTGVASQLQVTCLKGHLCEWSFVLNGVVQIPKFDPNPNSNHMPIPVFWTNDPSDKWTVPSRHRCHFGMHHYECMALLTNRLQSDWLWARLTASVHVSLWKSRSFRTVVNNNDTVLLTYTGFMYSNVIHQQKRQQINQLFGTHSNCLIEQSSLDGNGSWYFAEQLDTASNVAQATRTDHATTVCLNITHIST